MASTRSGENTTSAMPWGGSWLKSSPAVPKAVHTWTRLEDMLDELVNAQVWAGIHFRNSSLTGAAMGRKLGEVASEKVLRPLK